MTTSINTLFESIQASLATISRSEELIAELKADFIKNRKERSMFKYRTAVAECKTTIGLETRRAYHTLNNVANCFGDQLRFKENDLDTLKMNIKEYRKVWDAMCEGARNIGFAI